MKYHVVFTGLPGGPDNPAEFVEVNDTDGCSVGRNAGLEWHERDEFAELIFDDGADEIARLRKDSDEKVSCSQRYISKLERERDALQEKVVEQAAQLTAEDARAHEFVAGRLAEMKVEVERLQKLLNGMTSFAKVADRSQFTMRPVVDAALDAEHRGMLTTTLASACAVYRAKVETVRAPDEGHCIDPVGYIPASSMKTGNPPPKFG